MESELLPVPIRLKLKYRVGFSSSLKSKGNNIGIKHRHKLTSMAKQALPAVPEFVKFVDLLTGKERMIKTGRMLKHTGTQLRVVE